MSTRAKFAFKCNIIAYQISFYTNLFRWKVVDFTIFSILCWHFFNNFSWILLKKFEMLWKLTKFIARKKDVKVSPQIVKMFFGFRGRQKCIFMILKCPFIECCTSSFYQSDKVFFWKPSMLKLVSFKISLSYLIKFLDAKMQMS